MVSCKTYCQEPLNCHCGTSAVPGPVPQRPSPQPPRPRTRKRAPKMGFWFGVRQFYLGLFVVFALWLLVGGRSSDAWPWPSSHPTGNWMNQACGSYGPAVGSDFENDYGPSPLYFVTCADGVRVEAAQP